MTIIGKGVLNWFRGERISDRYGFIYLGKSPGPHNVMGSMDTDGSVELERSQSGCKGTLTSVVLEIRLSGHIGDILRGLYPSTPKIGDRIVLGTGRLTFKDEFEDGKPWYLVGLEPDDDRERDWLSPEALYRCHEQTVQLEFETVSAETNPPIGITSRPVSTEGLDDD